jgi:GNAT superfamily N-acetyltransferase
MMSVLADAFLLDPPTLAVLRCSPSAARERLAYLFRALLNSGPLGSGTVDVAREPLSGRVVGVAVWQGPDRVPHYFIELRDFLRALGLGGLARGIAAARASAPHRPTATHWCLQAAGVTAERRGCGIGSQLLSHRLKVVDAQQAAAYLESSTEVTTRLYQRHGFVPIGAVTGFPGETPPTAMWRNARR